MAHSLLYHSPSTRCEAAARLLFCSWLQSQEKESPQLLRWFVAVPRVSFRRMQAPRPKPVNLVHFPKHIKLNIREKKCWASSRNASLLHRCKNIGSGGHLAARRDLLSLLKIVFSRTGLSQTEIWLPEILAVWGKCGSVTVTSQTPRWFGGTQHTFMEQYVYNSIIFLFLYFLKFGLPWRKYVQYKRKLE